MNIVGTPYSDVHRSSATARKVAAGSNAGAGITTHAPCEVAARIVERMEQLGIEPVSSSPEQFDALIRAEIAKWAPVVKASGAKSD